MTIQIFKVIVVEDLEGEPESRTAQFTITDDGDPIYRYSMGGLPLTGGLQAILDANEVQLFAEAQAAGVLATTAEVELASQRAIYLADAGMVAAVFGGTPASVSSGIDTLVDAAFPAANATVRTALKRLFKSGQFCTRFVGFSEDLV